MTAGAASASNRERPSDILSGSHSKAKSPQATS
jgi:hypothetical protein